MIKIRRKRKFDQTAEITSLIDIVFILLIFFLLTAVFLPEGVPINLPEAQNTIEQSEDSVVISIDQDGKIYFNDQLMELNQLPDQIKSLANDQAITISADQKSDYGVFIKVMDKVKSFGNHPVLLSADSVKK